MFQNTNVLLHLMLVVAVAGCTAVYEQVSSINESSESTPNVEENESSNITIVEDRNESISGGLSCNNNRCTVDSYIAINETPYYKCIYEPVDICCGNSICESKSFNLTLGEGEDRTLGGYYFKIHVCSDYTPRMVFFAVNNETAKLKELENVIISNIKVQVLRIACTGKDNDIDLVDLGIELNDSELCPIDCSR